MSFEMVRVEKLFWQICLVSLIYQPHFNENRPYTCRNLLKYFFVCNFVLSSGQVKSKEVFYGQEPQNRESTTTECGVNYQLLSVMLLK